MVVDSDDSSSKKHLALVRRRRYYSRWMLLHIPLTVLVLIWTMDATSVEAQSTAVCHKHSLIVPTSAKHRSSNTLTIAHRGASYHLPEHTLAAYRLALELGADFIEPDLVVTSDAVLIALHTIDLNVTTDVVAKFGATHEPWYSPSAQRKGYWTFNFTWDEISQLTVQQRLPASRTTLYDGMFGVASLEQILDIL